METKLATPQDQVHRKRYYDLESIQEKINITQELVDKTWESKKVPDPVFLTEKDGTNYFISTYGE